MTRYFLNEGDGGWWYRYVPDAASGVGPTTDRPVRVVFVVAVVGHQNQKQPVVAPPPLVCVWFSSMLLISSSI
jgi:hypothetical protein